MTRLFFALSLPDSISDELDGLCEGIARARWALENDYHITLNFLGEVPGARVREVIEIAHSIRKPALELSLQGSGVYPHRGRPKVLWVGVQPDEALLSLQRTLQNELRHADFVLEKRKFRPHVTLARIEQCQHEHLTPWLGQHLLFKSAPFRVFRFHLFSSVLTSSGSRYALEESFRLGGPPA